MGIGSPSHPQATRVFPPPARARSRALHPAPVQSGKPPERTSAALGWLSCWRGHTLTPPACGASRPCGVRTMRFKLPCHVFFGAISIVSSRGDVSCLPQSHPSRLSLSLHRCAGCRRWQLQQHERSTDTPQRQVIVVLIPSWLRFLPLLRGCVLLL